MAAARGGEVDQRPVIVWPGADSTVASDALVLDQMSPVDTDAAVLVTVDNPFASVGPRLSQRFMEDPSRASAQLDAATESTRRAIAAALEGGADGIVYRLYGARAKHSTPMEYGGIYLERDRELLEEIRDARLNVLFLVGDDDLYLDFVSDLPAHVLAWDADASGFTSAQVRALRDGAQASSDPNSEILLHHSGIHLAARLDRF